MEIVADGCSHKLVIHQVDVEDEGTYSIEVGEHTSQAKLLVEGKTKEIAKNWVKSTESFHLLFYLPPAPAQALVMVKELQDVEVTEPEPASFQCEVSVAINKPPVWTFNGVTLQAGPDIRMENHGTVHKLTLRNTTVDMSGIVKFTMGKAKSNATLSVLEN